MQKIPVKVKLLRPDAKIPTYGTEEAAAFDIYSPEDVEIHPNEVKKIPIGISYEMPKGFHLQVWDRSSLGSKGIHHFAGIGDSDYRGELHVCLFNSTKEIFKIKKGDRVVQVVILPVIHAEFEQVEELNSTKRGHGGFGSTGR